MTLKFYLPKNTCDIFTSSRNKRYCSNLSLLLDRYFGYEQDEKNKKSEKGDFFKSIKNPFDLKLIEANYQRWQATVQSYHYRQIFTATPEWRMVVGLGQTSILETSMTLDRITGIPIIPSSALKGLAASYALLCILQKTNRVDEVEKEYKRYLKQEITELPEHYQEFIKIFGYQGEVGNVIFFDAVPTKVPKLEADIMNNHYPDYYGDKTGKTAPTPYQNPNPIYFLTLGKGSEFAFAISSRTQDDESQNLVNIACGWLQDGLSQLGIGAKTAAGYGYFQL